MRLLVAGQSGGVYIFEVGPGPLDSASKGMPCQELIANQEGKEGAEEEPQPQLSNHREVRHCISFLPLGVVLLSATMSHLSVLTAVKYYVCVDHALGICFLTAFHHFSDSVGNDSVWRVLSTSTKFADSIHAAQEIKKLHASLLHLVLSNAASDA